jgi:hypothetical protein
MSVVLLGSTSGSVTLQEPAVAGTTVLDLPATSGNVVVDSATQTLTNKTIEGGTVISGTAVASTSGTSIDFTSIPSWVKRITVMFAGVSTNSTAPITMRLGTSSGFVSSGYVGVQGSVGGTPASTDMSTGFEIYNDSAGSAYSGSITFSLLNSSSNIWVANGIVGVPSPAYIRYLGGTVTLSGVLTQIRITTTTGTPTFDAGSINILYE